MCVSGIALTSVSSYQVICEGGWVLIHMNITLAGPHHFGEEESGIWAHKSNLTQPLFIEVLVLSYESERSCIFVLLVSILGFYDFPDWNFRTILTIWYFPPFCNFALISLDKLYLYIYLHTFGFTVDFRV